MTFVRPAPSGLIVVVHAERTGRFSYRGIAWSFVIDVGLARSRDDLPLGINASRPFQFILDGDEALAEMCRIHNRVVADFAGLPAPGPNEPDGDRVAMLLDLVESRTHRGAPEAFWYRTAEHVSLWAEYLTRVLPRVIARVERSDLEGSGFGANIVLAPVG